MDIEYKNYQEKFEFVEKKSDDGIMIGIIRGYLATWDIDRGKDQFQKGCFLKSIARHQAECRPIRMKGYHRKIIGGFPFETIREDEKGLWVEGHINKEVQEGREIYALAKQGILSDMSIGYSAIDIEIENGIRVIKEAEIWEGSVVDEPMNPNAQISEVKTVNSRGELPKSFADRSYQWDASKAEKRVRDWTDGETNEKYKKAFLWWANDGENFADYKLGIADIIDGEIKIVPRAVFAVRAVLSGARGGVNIPESDKSKIKGIINILYKEMDMEAPFQDGKELPFHINELKNMQRSILFDVVRHHEISKSAAEIFVDAIADSESPSDGGESKVIVEALQEFKTKLNIRS